MPQATRQGRQAPTQSFLLPWTETLGAEALMLYEDTGRKALPWEAYLINNIMAVGADGMWIHSKFGYAVPRRNGKNEIITMVEEWGLHKQLRILHTAHRTSTSHAAWERLCAQLDRGGVKYDSQKANGRESITLQNPPGGVINFRTRTSTGGLGEGYDILIIDEAQEYNTAQESSLKYVVSDSKNPMTLMCGTPPTAISSGTVFTDYRRDVLQGGHATFGWAEWSVPERRDCWDIDSWYEANPSLGYHLTERKISEEIGKGEEQEIDFNIQRLGLWLQYNQKSDITEGEWTGLQCDEMPKLVGKLYVGIKYGRDGADVALSVAAQTEDGNIFVECIDCRPIRAGTLWVLQFLSLADIEEVVVDGVNGQQLLAADMAREKLKPPLLPTVAQVILANATWERNLYAKKIRHMGQPSLAQSVTNCDRRAIGTNGGFGWKSQREDIRIELMDSCILAAWQCSQNMTKPKRKQRASF